MLGKIAEPDNSTDPLHQLNGFRLKRLMQIIAVSVAGLVLAMGVANGSTKFWLLGGCVALAIAGLVAYYHRTLLAAYILLWSLALMLSGLAYSNGGLHDIAIFGFPCVLVYAAILGSNVLFLSLLAFCLSFCGLLALLTVATGAPAATGGPLQHANVNVRDTAAVQRNVAFGQANRVTGTPTTFFADGSRVAGAVPLERVEQGLNAKKP